MRPQGQQPAWVIEQVLDASAFGCCGDQDLFPFKCMSCGQPLVLCYECDTLFSDLANLPVQTPFQGATSRCPKCDGQFDVRFMRSPRHRISFAEWHRHGLDHLLGNCSAQELIQILSESSEAISNFLARKMLSTARIRLFEFRNLAEALAAGVAEAEAFRDRGRKIASDRALSEILDWHATINGPTNRSYALLGITDVLFPEE
jgi:hypothetical protein